MNLISDNHNITDLDYELIIKDILKDFNVLIEERKIDVDLHVMEHMAFYGIENRVRSVLSCIIKNAVTFIDKNKTSHKVKIFVTEYTGSTIIEVEDNGIGIAKKRHDEIFASFTRCINSQGKGLGLFTAKLILNKIGGSLMVESEPFKGSKFIVTIPSGLTLRSV